MPKNEIIGFVIEVSLFILTGFVIAKENYILALLTFGLSMVFAFVTGNMIYQRGKEDGSR